MFFRTGRVQQQQWWRSLPSRALWLPVARGLIVGPLLPNMLAKPALVADLSGCPPLLAPAPCALLPLSQAA